MKTRERIVVTSLELFNFFGEPNVTTVDIANEMDISPGNLYYHFRNKDEIILDILNRFEKDILDLLNNADAYLLTMEEGLMYCKLILEKTWQFRFFYRDLNNLTSKDKSFARRFNRLLKRQINVATHIVLTLEEGGVVRGSKKELEGLANQIVMTMVFWMSYESILKLTEHFGEVDLQRGVDLLMLLLSPYMSPTNRQLIADIVGTH